jgi:hypothetical protein
MATPTKVEAYIKRDGQYVLFDSGYRSVARVPGVDSGGCGRCDFCRACCCCSQERPRRYPFPGSGGHRRTHTCCTAGGAGVPRSTTRAAVQQISVGPGSAGGVVRRRSPSWVDRRQAAALGGLGDGCCQRCFQPDGVSVVPFGHQGYSVGAFATNGMEHGLIRGYDWRRCPLLVGIGSSTRHPRRSANTRCRQPGVDGVRNPDQGGRRYRHPQHRVRSNDSRGALLAVIVGTPANADRDGDHRRRPEDFTDQACLDHAMD